VTEAAAPVFKVLDCALTSLSAGKSAQNLRELRDHLASVPAESLAHHFYETLLRPGFDHPEFRNDFARWAQRQLHDEPLAERLGMVDLIEYDDLEQLRQALLDVVEDRLAEVSEVPQAAQGKEFHFSRSHLVVFDTGRRARTPEDLGSMVPGLSTGSIYYHFIDARRRRRDRRDDFSTWLEAWGAEYQLLRRRLEGFDFRWWSLSELRDRIARCWRPAGMEAEEA
jgi:hypothetical protein